jgi:hypothetical protein
MHTDFLCILYYTTLALHVSGAICTHHQEHKLQSTAVGTRDCYGVLEVGQSIGTGCGWVFQLQPVQTQSAYDNKRCPA